MSDTAPSRPPVRLPIPPDFPVTWDDPEEERLPWVQDRMHSPDPLPPLEGDFWNMAYEGFNRATEAYEMPVRARAKIIHSYQYLAIAPAVPPEQMEAQGRRSEERLREAIANLGDLWNGKYLPEIQACLAWWDAFDLGKAAMADLLAHLEETLVRSVRLWEIHFLTVFPTYVGISQFDELYRDLFGEEGAFSSFRLLQGFSNKTMESGRAMWDLSRKALASPEVRRALEERPAPEVFQALGHSAAGRAFQAALQDYLEAFGQRGDKWGLSFPAWIEDPSPVIQNLRDYILRTDRDPQREQDRMIAEREEAVARARERLVGYPQAVTGQFEFLLKAAQLGNVLTEDHGFWIDFNGSYRARRVLMAVGRRYAEAGSIERPEDVFYLTLAEIRDWARSLKEDLRPRVAERRADLEHYREIAPPPALGTDYGPPPDNPISRFLGKFFGGPPPVSEVADVLKGHPGSPGKVRGIARVIRSLGEAGKLKLGDVLVAETTAPPWTPLFATAGGIVTDTGGILSHCAVVAREYRIPAVVGTGRATTTILDGQTVEVDGDAGTVRIVRE